MASAKPIDDESTYIAGPVDPGIAQLVRAEVQAAIKGVHETFYASPPSYNSSVPLLSSSQAEDEADTEAQQEAGVTDQERAHAPMTLAAWMKLFVTLAPFLTVCVSWAVLIGVGVDPLAFSMLSLFLVLALLWYIILFACVQIQMEKSAKAKKAPSSENQTPDGPISKDWKVAMFTNLGILGIYVTFYGIIWGWSLLNSPPSVWHLYRVWHDLLAKIDAPDALSKLAVCLQEAIPNRNATIADISVCLKAMGMNDSYVE